MADNWYEEVTPATDTLPAPTDTSGDWYEEVGNAKQLTSTDQFLPGKVNVENLIASRPDLLSGFMQEMNTNPYTNGVNIGSVKNAMLQPSVALLKGVGGVLQRGEAAVANPLMTLQEGNINPTSLLNSITQGVQGKRLGELGDVPRRVGANELLSSLIGMGSSAGLLNLLTAGKVVSTADAAKLKGQEVLKNLDNLTRGGIDKIEAARLASQYGNTNASLVDKIKELLGKKLSGADNMFEKTITNAPDNIKINTKSLVDATQNAINELSSGFGKPNPVVSRLQGMIDEIRVKGFDTMDKQTFLGTRRNIGDMLTQNPEIDRVIMPVKEALDNSAIDAGIKDLSKAKNAYKTARNMESRFLTKTGDLKFAAAGSNAENTLSKIGMNKNLPKQTLDHIKELEKYINHPITKDATGINKINEALDWIKKAKKYGIISAISAIGGGTIAKKFF